MGDYMDMSNDLVFATDPMWRPNFCALVTFLPELDSVHLDKIAALSPVNPHDNAYHDDEAGYDGWELHGYYKGEGFTLYTRNGVLRVGGDPLKLDGKGFAAALKAMVQ